MSLVDLPLWELGSASLWRCGRSGCFRHTIGQYKHCWEVRRTTIEWSRHSPQLSLGMCTMRDLDGLLALLCKCSEDRQILSFGMLTTEGSINHILPKALDCMILEIWCCSVVLWILIVVNAQYALETFTSPCSTGEEVVFAFPIVSNLDLGFEKAVDWQMPSFMKPFCKQKSVHVWC